MKKSLFGLLFTAANLSFGNTPIADIDVELEKEIKMFKLEIKSAEDERIICTESCSRVIGGVTYTATAGNWFSTCEGAKERCEKKLDQLSTLNTSF